MNAKPAESDSTLNDPDDGPEWTNDQLNRAALAIGDVVVREANGTLTRPRGRPKLVQPKQQVSVRLDADLLQALKASGPNWQARMNAQLRKALGL